MQFRTSGNLEKQLSYLVSGCCGGTYLCPQHLGGGGRRVRSSILHGVKANLCWVRFYLKRQNKEANEAKNRKRKRRKNHCLEEDLAPYSQQTVAPKYRS